MLFKIILNYVFGYANIEIEGYYIERFINTCMKNNIFLWGMKRKLSTLVYAKVSSEELEEAKKIAQSHQCMITVRKQKGLPFLIEKYKHRKIFFIALIVLIVLLLSLSKFVWNIEVTGIDKIDKDEILQEIKSSGLKVGMFKKSVDVEGIVNKIRLDRNDIAWIGIELKGTNAIVKVVEAEAKPEIIDENDFSNIVASKDGEIAKISAQNGTVMVNVGDTVKKGDLLIAGWMEGKYTDKYYVNSNGSVKAKIRYSQTERIDKKEIKRIETGNVQKKYAIKINNFKINFFKNFSKFEKYDTKTSSKKLALSSNFYLPIEWIKYTNSEITEITEEHNYNEAKEIGEKVAREKMDKLIEGEVIDSNTEIVEYLDYYNVTITYDVIEEIGVKEKIEQQ